MKRLSLFVKWFAALGFATVMVMLFEVSRAYLREANFQLVNPWVKGLSHVVGYYEPIIIGVPLINCEYKQALRDLVQENRCQNTT